MGSPPPFAAVIAHHVVLGPDFCSPFGQTQVSVLSLFPFLGLLYGDALHRTSCTRGVSVLTRSSPRAHSGGPLVGHAT